MKEFTINKLFAIFVILISGCATTYQPQSFTGGFSETQLAENIFQVLFNGNAYTASPPTPQAKGLLISTCLDLRS